MATTYKSTIEVNVWKEHTCLGCGSRFRYLFKRKKTGQGGTPDAASAAARKAVLDALQNEVDSHPCPGCGLYQPDMVGSRRGVWHGWLFVATFVVLLPLLILMLCDVLPYGTAAWAMAGGCGLLGLVHLLIDRSNPNRNLDGNQRLAQQRVERGDLWVPPGAVPRPENEAPAFGWSAAHAVAYALFGLGLLSLAMPELLRLVHGWPDNRQWYPQTAGPGDDPYVYFPAKITSVKGYWQGKGTARVLNAQEVGLANPDLRVVSQNDTWGQTIQIGSKESKTKTNTVWLRVLLPPDAQLEGKTLKLKLLLDVTYPKLHGNSWEPAGGHFEHGADLVLGGAGAGRRYKTWWWGGFGGGVLLLILSSVLLQRLAGGMRKLANPTNIFVPGDDEPAPAPEEPPEVLPAERPRPDDSEGIVRRD